jgi:hypothetical protein
MSKVGRKMRPVAFFVIEILTLHKGLVQATPSTRTLGLRVADITISSVPTQHAQHKVAAKFEVATGSANSSLELTTREQVIQPENENNDRTHTWVVNNHFPSA